MWDIVREVVDIEYDLGEGVSGKSAIPYKEGLLYSCFQIDKETQEPVNWQIIYQEGNKRTVLIEGEEEYSILATPENDDVYYGYRDGNKWGVRKLGGDDKVAIVAVFDDIDTVYQLQIKDGICCIGMWSKDSTIFSATEGENILWKLKLGNSGAIVADVNDAYVLYYENESKENGLAAIGIKRVRSSKVI